MNMVMILLMFIRTERLCVWQMHKSGKTIKAGKVLFQRLLVAKYAWREIDLKKQLCHELSPVPLAIADTAGNLRPTNKAALGKLLEEDVRVETLPTTELKTCTIIDG